MKRLFLLFSFTIVCLLSCGQNQNEAIKALKKEVVEANRQLPRTTLFVTMEKVEIKGDDYIMRATIDEEQVDFDQYVSDLNQNKSNAFSLVAGNNTGFSDLLAESGLNLRFIVTGKQSQSESEILISSEEINNPSEEEYSARDLMSEIVDDLSKNVPEDWGDGLTLTKVYISGDYICQEIMTDETMITMAMLKKAKSESTILEDGLLEGLNESNDFADVLYAKYLKKSGLGIKQIYWSKKSPDKVTVTITPSKIKNTLKDK